MYFSSLIEQKRVLNPEKSKCMLLSRSHGTDNNIGIHTLQNAQIEIVDSYKCLGIWLEAFFPDSCGTRNQKAEKENWFPFQK